MSRLHFDTSAAESEELKAVGNLRETVAPGHCGLEFGGKALFNLDDEGTSGADQVMVVAILPFRNQFKTGCAIPKVEPAHESHFLEGVEVSVNGGEVAALISQGLVDFSIRQGMLVSAKDVQNGLSRSGDLAGVFPQFVGQLTQRRLHQSVKVRMRGARLVHVLLNFGCGVRCRQRLPMREMTKRALLVTTIVGPPGKLS